MRLWLKNSGNTRVIILTANTIVLIVLLSLSFGADECNERLTHGECTKGWFYRRYVEKLDVSDKLFFTIVSVNEWKMNYFRFLWNCSLADVLRGPYSRVRNWILWSTRRTRPTNFTYAVIFTKSCESFLIYTLKSIILFYKRLDSISAWSICCYGLT